MTSLFDFAPLKVRMVADCGLLHSNLTLELPQRVACSLIGRRLAVPVADVSLFPDASLTMAELEYADVPWLLEYATDDSAPEAAA